MNGFHSIWSKPYCDSNAKGEFWMQDYDLLTMIMSALMYRKYNGSIELMADKAAIDYIKGLGLESLWNLGVKEFEVPSDINPNVFWAAGKLFSLREINMPAVMVDLDLIIWKDISEYVNNYDICVIHREDISEEVYPGKEFFRLKDGYEFNSSWDWNEMPCNTAMLYLKDNDFKDYYVEQSIEFMRNVDEQSENLRNMVFAEQRLISMCARFKNKNIGSFFHTANYINNQDMFTHVWGHKNILKFNYQARVDFCKKLTNRIIAEFPEQIQLIKQIPELEKYL